MKKKVVHVLWSVALGGIERVCYSLAKEQLNSGDFTPALLIAKHNGPLPDHFQNFSAEIKIAGFKNGYDFNSKALKVCKEAFASADIIHIHSFNPVIAYLAKKSEKKIIYTEHGNFAFSRKRSFSEIISTRLLKKFLNSNVDLVTFNSKFSESIAIERYNLNKVKKEVVYNGTTDLPSHISSWSSSLLKSDSLKVVTVSRLVEFKKIDRLIQAFAKADNKNLQLIITGEGHMRTSLEDLVAELKIKDKVIFTGSLPAYSIMQIAHLCVFPSQHEPFGLVAVEALQLGKPVVAFNDGGGLTEIIAGLNSEFIVKNESELTKIISSLPQINNVINSSEQQLKRKKIAGDFSIHNMVLHFDKLYKSIT